MLTSIKTNWLAYQILYRKCVSNNWGRLWYWFKLPGPIDSTSSATSNSASNLLKICSAEAFASAGQSTARCARDRLLPRCDSNEGIALEESVAARLAFLDQIPACTVVCIRGVGRRQRTGRSKWHIKNPRASAMPIYSNYRYSFVVWHKNFPRVNFIFKKSFFEDF